MLTDTKYMQVWLDNCGLRADTIKGYSVGLRRFETFLIELGVDFANLDFDKFYEDPSTHRTYPMGREVLHDFVSWLRNQYDSEPTVSQYWLGVRHWFVTLYNFGAIETNPVTGVDVQFGDRKRRTDVLTDQEFRRLVQVAYLHDTTSLIYVCILLLLHVGLRNKELRMLRVQDVDLKIRTIHLLCGTKLDKPRDVPMTEKLRAALSKYLEHRESKSTEILFHKDGRMLRASELLGLVHHFQEESGIDRSVFPHLFRHTGLTRMYRTGTSPRDIQDIAGHGDIMTTEGYIHINAEEQRPYLEASPMNKVLMDVLGMM